MGGGVFFITFIVQGKKGWGLGVLMSGRSVCPEASGL